jgi:hypothetical protein
MGIKPEKGRRNRNLRNVVDSTCGLVHWGFMGLSSGSTGPPRVGMGHVFMKILGLQVYNYPFDGFPFSATVEQELTYQWSNKNQGIV